MNSRAISFVKGEKCRERVFNLVFPTTATSSGFNKKQLLELSIRGSRPKCFIIYDVVLWSGVVVDRIMMEKIEMSDGNTCVVLKSLRLGN